MCAIIVITNNTKYIFITIFIYICIHTFNLQVIRKSYKLDNWSNNFGMIYTLIWFLLYISAYFGRFINI